jgi:hypothetical protein
VLELYVFLVYTSVCAQAQVSTILIFLFFPAQTHIARARRQKKTPAVPTALSTCPVTPYTALHTHIAQKVIHPHHPRGRQKKRPSPRTCGISIYFFLLSHAGVLYMELFNSKIGGFMQLISLNVYLPKPVDGLTDSIKTKCDTLYVESHAGAMGYHNYKVLLGAIARFKFVLETGWFCISVSKPFKLGWK